MPTAGLLVRTARMEAGLTQAELGAGAGLSQAAVARLEQPGSNPTLRTLQRVLAATGHRLVLQPATDDTDASQIVERLKLTPAQRLSAHTRSQRNLARLKASARRVTA